MRGLSLSAFSAFVLPALAAMAAGDDDPKAVQLYRDVYGADHDRVAKSKDGAEKVRFAARLVAAAKVAADDAAFSRLLKDRAIEFASADPAGHPVALELLRERLAGDGAKTTAWEAIADLLERSLRAGKPGARAEQAGELVKAYSDLAKENMRVGRAEAAIKALVRAKAVVRAELKASKELLAELDQQTEAINKRRRDDARLAQAVQTLRENPRDPAANGVVGMHLLAADGDPVKAAPHLAKSGDPALRKLGEALSARTPKVLETADAYRAAAAAAADKDGRNALYTRAVALYQEALDADPKQPEALRIKLVISQIADSAGIRPAAPATSSMVPAKPTDPPTKPADPPTKPTDPPTKPTDPPAASDKPGLRERGRIAAGAEQQALAFSPDGTVLAGGGGDGTLRLWDASAGRERASLAGHSGPIRAVAFAPSGKLIAAGGADGTVRLWLPGENRKSARINAHGPGVNAVAFSADGRTLGTGGDDKAVKLWGLPDDPAEFTGKDRDALTGLPGNVKSLRFVPGSQAAVFGCSDGKAVLFDKSLPKPFADCGHDEAIGPVAVSPDGQALAVGGASGTVHLWKTATREPSGRLKGRRGPATQVEFSPDGAWIAVLAGGSLRVFRFADASEWAAFDAGSAPAAFAISPDGKTLAVACPDKTVRLVEVVGAPRRQ